MSPEAYSRYLRLLGIDDTPSGIDGLREVVRRHVVRVPFENISKLLLFAREGAGRFLTLDEFLDGIEQHDLGGTCHSCNPLLTDLLRALGYDADLLGGDMSQPNVHTCIRVRLDSAVYHVDVGYGGPFREPMPLPFEVVEGGDRYVFDRDGLAVYSNGNREHGYTVHHTPRSRDFFTPTMLDSFKPTATFMNNLRICRMFDNHSLTLFNRSLRIHRGTETTAVEIETPRQMSSVIADQMLLPKLPWEEAVAVLQKTTGKPFFALTNSASGSPRPH